MAVNTDAINAPIEPLDGFAIDGAADRCVGIDFRAAADLADASGVPENRMDGSSAIIAISRPAQPN